MDKFEGISSKYGSTPGKVRHQVLSAILNPASSNFINQIDLGSKMNGLDLGCGTGETTMLLKTRMHPKSKMIGMDSNKTQLKMASEKLNQEKLSNVEFHYVNILEWVADNLYDLVYSRSFFNQFGDAQAMLKKVYASLKTGGVALIEDLDLSKFQCFPNSNAFDRFIELYSEVVKRQNGYGNRGQQLLEWFQQAGFKNSKVQWVRPRFLSLQNKRIISLTLVSISTILVKEKLIDPIELQVILNELQLIEAQENTMITLPAIYQVRGYK